MSIVVSIVILILSMVIFLVLFFGIGFILNMILRMSWVMAIIYPLVAIFIIDKVSFSEYFTNTKVAFSDLGHRISSLTLADNLILLSGFTGAILAGITIKILRKIGYQMF